MLEISGKYSLTVAFAVAIDWQARNISILLDINNGSVETFGFIGVFADYIKR